MPEPKRRGRPKTTGTTPPLNIRVPKAVQEAARKAADDRGERFAAVVTRLLAEYAKKDQ